MKNKVIKGNFKNKKYIVHNEDSSDSKDIIIEKYNYLINAMKVNSSKILVLTLNRAQSLEIKKNIEFTAASSLNISSFFSFEQNELKKYWPIILKNCDKIISKKIMPVFMTFEASQSLMAKLVVFLRSKGELKEITMSDEEIAQKALSNLSILAFSNQNYLLYKKFMLRDKADSNPKSLYSIGKLINLYVERVLKEGVLDFSLSVYLYNNYLIKDKIYLEKLKEKIDYLIVDKGELMYPCQVDFINTMEDSLEELCIFYNPAGPYGIYSPNRFYTEEKIIGKYMDIYIEKNENNKGNAIKIIEENILYDQSKEIENKYIKTDFESDVNTQVHQKLINNLDSLFEKNHNLNDTAIILPSRDISLEYFLERYTKEKNIDFLMLNRNEKIIDNKYINALIVFAQLYYSFDEISINTDELKIFFSVMLNINIIKGSLLANYIYKANIDKIKLIEIKDNKLIKRIGEKNIKNYLALKNFIDNNNETFEDISDFFKEVYLKFYINKKNNKELIKECRNIIESAKSFTDAVKVFENIQNENLEFLKFIRNGAKENENIYQIEERVDFKGLILASPVTYINYNKKSENLFMLDINNNLWLMNSVNPIQNPFVMSKGWNEMLDFSDDKYEEIRRLELASIIKRIFLSTKNNIYIYSHKYNSFGMDTKSMLSNIFNKKEEICT